MDRTNKTRAIVLKAIRYGDNSLIVKLLTEQSGLQSFMIKGAFNKTSKIRAALFQPLTLLEVVAANSRGDLGYLREATVEYSYKTIPFDINKYSIVLFISELLSKAIQDSETDIELFDFIHNALTHLDEMSANCADFPLKFSIKLSHYLGFSPNISDYEKGYVFDLQEGCFRHDGNGVIYLIDNQLSELFKKICTASISDDANLNLRNSDRRQLLEHVVTYYKLHVSGFNDMNSNEILKSVLSDTTRVSSL